MFRYFLSFLLINTCYQSFGIPIPAPKQLLSKSLGTLAGQCENAYLSNHLMNLVNDCSVYVPPYSKKQFQCLIFYDINSQLCSAVAASKLKVTEDAFAKIDEKQDVNDVCALAREWVFTNMSDFVNYKESAEKFFKLPATCGEVCGVEDTMNEANYYCKYYKWGLEMLKTQQVSTAPSNPNNAVAPPIVSGPDSNIEADIPAAINSNPFIPQDADTKKQDGQIKQTEPAVAKTTPQKEEEANINAVVKSEAAVQATSKQTPSIEDVNVVEKNEEGDQLAAPENVLPNNDHANKTVVQAEKPAPAVEVPVPELVNNVPLEQKPVIENPKAKPIADAEDYADSDGNDNIGDDEAEDPGMDLKPEQEPQPNIIVKHKLEPLPHEPDVSQKEYFPNSMPDGFSEEDNDHFFPFFMTSVVLMVLLYVLYHNKSKVSKVFFGLILEGRQSGRRRNSRGHAYRRLDTLEQAMSANTAAPPSKIIY